MTRTTRKSVRCSKCLLECKYSATLYSMYLSPYFSVCVCVCRCAFVFVYLVYHGFHYGCGCVSFALRWLMSPFDFENVNLLSSSASLSLILIHVLNAKRLDSTPTRRVVDGAGNGDGVGGVVCQHVSCADW